VTSASSGTTAVPTGSVIFFNGTQKIGAGLLVSGKAAFTTAVLPAVSDSITASYLGDANYVGSISVSATQTVNQASTTTTLAASPNPAAFGQPVVFTATVKSLPPSTVAAKGGAVTFADGGPTIGTASLNASDQAILTTSALLPGSHSITA